MFTGFETGLYATSILIYKDTGVEKTSPLIVYFGEAFGVLPLITIGPEILVRWNNGPHKIFNQPLDAV